MLVPLSLLVYPQAPLAPDDALYLSAAHSIAEGHGASMPDREAFLVRSPLFPGVLATGIVLFGDPLGPRLVQLLLAGALVALLLALADRWFTFSAGVIAVLLVFSNPAFVELLVSLRIDVFAGVLVLGAVVVFTDSTRRRSFSRAIAGGCLLGFAILAKETAAVLVVVPLAYGLLAARTQDDGWTRGVTAAAFGTVVVCTWWWLYYWALTGRFFLTSLQGAAAAAGITVTVLALAATGLAVIRFARAPGRSSATVLEAWLARRRLSAYGISLVVAWTLATYAGLNTSAQTAGPGESHLSWSALVDFLDRDLQPFVSPALVVVLGVAAVITVRRRDRMLVGPALVVVLYLPLGLAVAARDWATGARNLLVPLLLVQLLVADGIVRLNRMLDQAAQTPAAANRQARRTLGMLAVVALAVVGLVTGSWQRQADYRASRASAAQRSGWDRPEVAAMAGWIEANVPGGTPIMTSWLFGAQLARLTEAAYPMSLLPTEKLAVSTDGEEPLRPAGTLFRFHDHRFVSEPTDDWLFVRRHPREGYLVGLSQQRLLDELHRCECDYLVVSGEHHTQSTMHIVGSLLRVPGVSSVHQTGGRGTGLALLRVDRSALGPVEGLPVSLNGPTFIALLKELNTTRHLDAIAAVKLLGGERLSIVPESSWEERVAARLAGIVEYLREKNAMGDATDA